MKPSKEFRAVITAPHTLELQDHPLTSAAPSQILLRTCKTLISAGTELAFFGGTHSALSDPDITWVKYPFFPGYAAISEVLEIGCEVLAPDIQVGSRVLHFGAHASWSTLDPATDVCVPLQPSDNDSEILFARLVQIAQTALHRRHCSPGRTLVIGAGLVGLFAARALQLSHEPLVAIQDISPERLALAQECGVELTIESGGNPKEEIRAVFGPSGPDCIIDASGAPGLAASTLSWVKWGGEVVLLGAPGGTTPIDLYKHVMLKSATLTGAHEGFFPNHASEKGVISRQHLNEQGAAWIRSGEINVKPLISEITPASQIAFIYADMLRDRAKYVGVVVDWEAASA